MMLQSLSIIVIFSFHSYALLCPVCIICTRIFPLQLFLSHVIFNQCLHNLLSSFALSEKTHPTCEVYFIVPMIVRNSLSVYDSMT